MTSDGTGQRQNPLSRRVGLSLVGLIVAIAVIVALAARSGVTMESVLTLVAASPWWLVPAVAVLTAGQIALSAVKWHMVLTRVSSGSNVTAGFAFHVSVASAFLSQVMTSYLSAVVTRSWAARRAHGVSLGAGAGTSLFEQIFDVAIIAAMLAPTLIVYFLGGSFSLWLGLTAVSLTAGAVIFLMLGRNVQYLPVSDAKTGLVARLFAAFRSASAAGLFAPGMVLKLYALSVLRYLLILARVPVTIAALALAIGMMDAAQGFTVVQATQLASITPGNLGIQELSWTGVLVLRDTPLELAAAFAIAFRIVTFLSMGLVALISGAAFFLPLGSKA